MNVSDQQYQESMREADRLRAAGFIFNITTDGYTVNYKEHFVSGASVELPRTHALAWQYRLDNLRDNLDAAILSAHRSEFYKCKIPGCKVGHP